MRKIIFLVALILSAFYGNKASAQKWVSTAVVGPFYCWADFNLEDVAGELQGLQEIHQQLTQKIGLPKTKEWIELYIFKDNASWRLFLKEKYPEVPYRRALYIKKKDENGQLFLHLHREFSVDLRHEGTHALIHASVMASDMPIWLDEGLAEYFEVPAGNRQTGSVWFAKTEWNAKFGITPDLEALEKIQGMQNMTNNDYRDSWAWVNFLLNGPNEVRNILPEYVAAIHSGEETSRVKQRVWDALEKPSAKFRAYFKNLK